MGGLCVANGDGRHLQARRRLQPEQRAARRARRSTCTTASTRPARRSRPRGRCCRRSPTSARRCRARAERSRHGTKAILAALSPRRCSPPAAAAATTRDRCRRRPREVPASASTSIDGFIDYLKSWSRRRPTCSSRSTRPRSPVRPTRPASRRRWTETMRREALAPPLRSHRDADALHFRPAPWRPVFLFAATAACGRADRPDARRRGDRGAAGGRRRPRRGQAAAPAARGAARRCRARGARRAARARPRPPGRRSALRRPGAGRAPALARRSDRAGRGAADARHPAAVPARLRCLGGEPAPAARAPRRSGPGRRPG